MHLIQKPKQKIILRTIQDEIAKNYLHNLDGHALVSYGYDEKIE